jgi:hypothetical protein
LLAACSKWEAPATVASTQAPPAGKAPSAKARGKACDMVTQAEMSAILGAAVVASAYERPDFSTKCTYSPASGTKPHAQLTVDWDSGPAGMMAAGMAAANAPRGTVDPLQGVGEQAVHVVGGMYLINTGEHLMTLDFDGVEDLAPKVRKIYETARDRM